MSGSSSINYDSTKTTNNQEARRHLPRLKFVVRNLEMHNSISPKYPAKKFGPKIRFGGKIYIKENKTLFHQAAPLQGGPGQQVMLSDACE
jgi:hypothetical protein